LGVMSALVMDFADGTLGVVGQLPEDGYERGVAYAQGQKPWSLRVGDRHIPATSLGPMAIPISLAAAYVEAFKRDPKKPAMEPFSRIIAPGLSVMLDSTMLQTSSNFLESVRDPRAADKFTGRTATMLIPYGGALRTVRDQMDPVLRDPGGKGATARFGQREGITGTIQSMGRNVQEEIEASLPYFSENVRPRYNAYGEPIQRPEAKARLIGTDPGSDPVGEELMRLKKAFPSWEDNALYPSDLDGGITSFEGQVKKGVSKNLTKDQKAKLEGFMLTDEQRNTYKSVVGGAIGDVLKAVIASPVYASLPDEKKAEAIRNERNRARDLAVDMFTAMIKDDVKARVNGLLAK
jgi:hypothetical protein